MNIQANINKLLYALKQENMNYQIKTSNFYSERAQKYITNYKVMMEVEYIPKSELEKISLGIKTEQEVEKKKKYLEVLNTYSKIEILKLLAEDYKNINEEKNKQKE